jgi:autotransporter-associated beta strand protein
MSPTKQGIQPARVFFKTSLPEMKPKFPACNCLSPLFRASFAALTVASSSAAEITYRPIATSTTNPTVNTNWVGDVLPGTGDSAYWSINSRPDIIFPSAVSWGAIRAEDATAAIVFSGSPITLMGLSAPLYGGAAVVQGITEVRWENFTVGNNIVLGSDQTWNIGNFATGAASATMTHNGVLSGAFNLTKVGAGTLNLNGNNSGYTRTLTIRAGTLNLSGAFGGSVAVSGGTLNLNTGVTIPSPTFSGGTLTLNAGSTVTGAITTLGTATLNLGGAVGGTVTLGPTDTLGLRGSAITGNLILDSNTLNRISSVTASGNIQVAGANVVNIASAAFGAPMTILSCAGTLTDTDDSDPSNNFTIGNVGVFRSLPVLTTTSNSVQVSVAAGDARTWTGAAAINPTFWNVNTTANWSGGDSLFLHGDAVTFDDTATPVTPVTVAIQGLVSPSAITFNNTAKAYTVTGAAGNGITGSTGLTKSGTGVLTLGGIGNTFTGNVQVNAGSLVVSNWEALGATGKTITIASGANVNLNGSQPSSVGRDYTWNIVGDGVSSSGAITNSGGSVTNFAGIQTLQLSANASLGGTGRFDIGRSGNNFGTIQGNGFTLTKNGTNLVVVRAPASNITYVLNSGGLTFEDSDAATGSNTITVNGGTLGSFGTRTFGNNLNFTAAGAILESGGNVGTWNGNISLNGDVTFRCSNAMVINGTVSGTGNITKEGGSALRIGTGGTTGDIGTRNVNTTAASRLEVNRSGSLTLAGNITGLNAFSSLGSGTTTLTGNNTWSNETRVLGGGTLSVTTVADGGGAGALGNGTNAGAAWLRVAANSTLRITGTGIQTTARLLWNDNTTGAESGTGIFDVVDAGASVVFSNTGGANNQSLTKTGAGSLTLSRFITGTATVTVSGGTLVLTGANVHTGGTVVNAGTLSIGNGGTTGTNTGNITNNASVVFNRSDASTYAGIISGSGSLQKLGAGTLSLSNANTYSGSTTVNGGTLNLLDNASLRFVIGANGVNNTLTGSGAAILAGDFVLDLTGANSTNGNSWQLVNVGTLTETYDPTFTLVGFTEVASVHTLTVGATTWTFTEATGLLTASSAESPFSTWINGFTFAPGADKTPTGDPDGDGLSNQQEYAFGLLPNDGSSVSAITVQVDKTAGTFTYTRRKPALTGLNYKVWISTDLSAWTQDLTAVQSPTDVGDNQNVVVTLTGAPLTATKLFVRVTAD